MNQTLSHPALTRQLNLAALPSAAPWARRMISHLLQEWRLEALSDTALLLVSELVTNAVKAAGNVCRCDGSPARWQMIGLTVGLTETGLLIEVWDPDAALPARQEPDLASEGGRGLLIVECLADSWGHHAADGGKTVWCELALGS